IGGIYGYSHTCGGYDGGQAELVRVPFADVNPMVIPEWLDPDDALMMTDALSTGYFGAQLGDIEEGDTVAVFGAGPVGLFAALSSWFMGAGRVIVFDHLDYRLEKAREFAHAETYNFGELGDVVLPLQPIPADRGGGGRRGVPAARHLGEVETAGRFADRTQLGDRRSPQGRNGRRRRRVRADVQRRQVRRRHEQGAHAAHEPGTRQTAVAPTSRA